MLRVPDDEFVDKARAREIRDLWAGSMQSSDVGRPIRFEGTGCTFTIDATKVIGNFLLAFADRITEVKLSDIGQLPEVKALDVIGSFKASLESAPLVEINLSSNILGHSGIKRMLSLLKKPTLRRLCLDRTGLDGSAMMVLYRELPCKHLITHLALSDNPDCGVDGAIAFSRLIDECPNVVHIEYANNEPGAAGSKYIVRALDKIIDWHSDQGMKCKICHLNFHGCEVSIVGGFDKLISALRNLTHLVRVDLADCAIHESGTKKLERILLRENPDLTDDQLLLNQGDDDSDVEEIIEDFSQMPPVGRLYIN